MPNRMILLVEDDVLIRSIAAEALQDLGWLIEEAGTAADALEKFRAHAGDIEAAVIDIGLPDRKGDELAHDLRQLNSRLPIALVTGYGSDSVERSFPEDARVAYLGKPYDLDQLEAVLARFGLKCR